MNLHLFKLFIKWRVSLFGWVAS